MGELTPSFDMHRREGRIAGLRRIVGDMATEPRLRFIESQLRGLIPSKVTADQELDLLCQLHSALVDAEYPEGLAWKAWMPLRAEVSRLATEAAPAQPWATYYSSDHSEVLLANLNRCVRSLRNSSNEPLRLHLVLSAIVQVHGLLEDHLWKQVFAPLQKLPRSTEEAREALHTHLNLGWVPDLPARLADVRDGWCHGFAELSDDGIVVLDRHTRQVKANLTLPQLERYAICGRATWTAFQLDLIYGAALFESREGTLRLERLPERLRPRRSMPSESDEGQEPKE